MADSYPSSPSFSPGRKWSIGLNVGLIVLVVLAVVIMVNYLSRDYFLRFQCGAAGKVQLSDRTVNLVRSLTNNVKITLYYDKSDSLYSLVAGLLNEYKLLNPRISVQTVDFNRDAGAAQKVKAQYKLGSATDKNLVIFDSNGKSFPIPGNALAEYTLEQIPGEKENNVRRKATVFKGEMMFTSVLLALANPKPVKAFVLQGHGEHQIDSGEDALGYLKFASVLRQNSIQVESLALLGTNAVPLECDLLIIPGPTIAIPDPELEKIEQYLNQGGRLFALFNAKSASRPVGLEKILAKWGVAIGPFVVIDLDHSNEGAGLDVVVSAFTKHPIVNPLVGEGLYLIQPRPVGKFKTASEGADTPHVEPIAFSGPKAYAEVDPSKSPRQFPFMVAVEKGVLKGVITARGTTRLIVTGDSLFLANRNIDSLANRDFVGLASNWLLDRTQVLEGLGPRDIREYKLIMTKAQMQTAQWLMLAGMPGATLLLGSLVWLRRRR